MKDNEIKAGARYTAKVNGRLVTVQVLDYGTQYSTRYRRRYLVRNETTGRRTHVTAAKLRGPAPERGRFTLSEQRRADAMADASRYGLAALRHLFGPARFFMALDQCVREDETAVGYAYRAAHAAFRAVPGLREPEAKAHQDASVTALLDHDLA